MRKFKKGFTLVELLIVISILGVLTTIGLVSFASAQMRGRDSQRKSDLKQISTSLELYFSDHQAYPTSTSGKINACPSTTATSCNWGSGEFTDGATTYFRTLPRDPTNSNSYYYRIVDTGVNQKFQIFAHIENTQDPTCLPDSGGTPNCISPELSGAFDCGGVCNFAITSPNVKASE